MAQKIFKDGISAAESMKREPYYTPEEWAKYNGLREKGMHPDAANQVLENEFQPTKQTIWNDPKHPLYGIGPEEQNVDYLKSAIAEITRNTQSPAHFKFYAGNSGGTMGQAKKKLEQYKKALDYIENFGRR